MVLLRRLRSANARVARVVTVVLVATLVALFLSACIPQSPPLGPRPGQTPLEAAEAYLQKYQPGTTPRVFQTTRIYDRNGVLIARLWNEGQRTWLPFHKIPKNLVDATIAAEDSTFYYNTGIDSARVIGAALQNWQEGQIVSGASTITMQLARNLFLGPDERYEQSMDRKMLEAGLAQDLTSLFSKDEILEMYLNLANYGHLAYGPEAASQVYFGKSASELTLPEAALLAGIPQAPANLDPFKNLAGAKARQRTVLDLMVRHRLLNQADADWAYNQPITLNPSPDGRFNLLPHFVNYVTDTLDARLGGAAGIRAGLTVTSTLDVRAQSLAQDIVAKQVKALKSKNDMSNAALVAMLPHNGEILAMVGSADFNDDKIAGQVNVTRALRQPGSAIKPVLYAAAMDDMLISPATVLWDIPVSYPITGTAPYAPRNYDGKFHGPVTVRTALANSYNVPAVKLLEAVTVDRMLKGAELMGIRSLSDSGRTFGLALTLGGGDVTLLELTNAYNVLASDGQGVRPEPVLEAVDAYGRPVLAARRPGGEPLQVVKASTAYLLTDILSDNDARKPMFGANSPLKISKPAAAKTGTTDDWRDNWTLGYTRYLVAGVWAGNSDGHPMKRVSGIAGAAPIWHDFMEAVLKQPEILGEIGAPGASDEAAWQFQPPADVVVVPGACPPRMACRKGGEIFSAEWLAAAGDAGPLADTVSLVQAAPVAAGKGYVAYCRTLPAATRALLKLPGPLGLPQASNPISSGLTLAPQIATNFLQDNASPATGARAPRQVDVLRAVAWSLRTATPVDLGPCDGLSQTVRQSGAGIAARADLASAGNPKAGVYADLVASVKGIGPTQAQPVAIVVPTPSAQQASPTPDAPTPEAVTPTPEPQAAPVVVAAEGDLKFGLAQAIQNHNACPGQYIVGAVLNRAGRPMAGVHIVMVDEWGNRADAYSKSGANDSGEYDFPINTTPNRFTLTVVDASGSAVSAPVTIEHLQGYGGNAPCHTVVWQAY
jgi:penicillin-binding protein 1C